MRSTSLKLSSSLHVKGLTQRCKVQNGKNHKLVQIYLDTGSLPSATTSSSPQPSAPIPPPWTMLIPESPPQAPPLSWAHALCITFHHCLLIHHHQLMLILVHHLPSFLHVSMPIPSFECIKTTTAFSFSLYACVPYVNVVSCIEMSWMKRQLMPYTIITNSLSTNDLVTRTSFVAMHLALETI